jgi:2-keto-3-deoxy-L-rhamnonate aldolase RhmA
MLNTVPHTWRSACIIPLFKREIRTNVTIIGEFSDLNSAYKIYNKISKTLTDAVLLDKQQGSRKEKSTMLNTFTAQQIIEKRHEFRLETLQKHLIKQTAINYGTSTINSTSNPPYRDYKMCI